MKGPSLEIEDVFEEENKKTYPHEREREKKNLIIRRATVDSKLGINEAGEKESYMVNESEECVTERMFVVER